MVKNSAWKGGFNVNISCNVCLDLLPLVRDGVASEDSNILVKDHIQTCDSCRVLFESEGGVASTPNDDKVLRKVKNKLTLTLLMILFAGTLYGAVITDGMGQFYNFIIMPAIGGIGFLLLPKRWFLIPFAVFLISLITLWQKSMFMYAVIYALLSLLGVFIAFLLKFAFRKDGEK